MVAFIYHVIINATVLKYIDSNVLCLSWSSFLSKKEWSKEAERWLSHAKVCYIDRTQNNNIIQDTPHEYNLQLFTPINQHGFFPKTIKWELPK